MSESPNREFDPDPARRTGDRPRPIRRKVGPAKIALAFVLAVAITALTFAVLAVVLWLLRMLFH